MSIRGDKGDYAVLCTAGKTYEVREAETSNTLLLSTDCCLPTSLKETNDPLIHKEVRSTGMCVLVCSDEVPSLARPSSSAVSDVARGFRIPRSWCTFGHYCPRGRCGQAVATTWVSSWDLNNLGGQDSS